MARGNFGNQEQHRKAGEMGGQARQQGRNSTSEQRKTGHMGDNSQQGNSRGAWEDNKQARNMSSERGDNDMQYDSEEEYNTDIDALNK